ncbi:MAG: DUF4199 domain-containing protein [Ignavibacteria bacterium]|nr:DUF4199 domain-containing protein [Ignavibacteria bacterium]
MKDLKIEFKWALIFVVMMLLWMVFEKLAGFHDVNIDKHAVITNFVAIPAVAVYVFALLDKKKNFYNGNMSYKQGFICGLIITIIVTVISPLSQYIINTFITPDYFTNISAYAVNEGKMTQEEAEKFFNLNSYIVQGLVGAFIMGIITSAIVAFFTKSKNPTT